MSLLGGAAERLSTGGGTDSYDIAASGEYAFHTYSTIDAAPTSELVSLPDHRRVRVLADNWVYFKGHRVLDRVSGKHGRNKLPSHYTSIACRREQACRQNLSNFQSSSP